MDFLPLLGIHNIGYLADLQELSRGRQAAGEVPIGPEGQAAFLVWRERAERHRRARFPIIDKLTS